jgi:hypothetical protein
MFMARKLSPPPRVRPEKGTDLDRGVHDSALGVSIGVPICVPIDLTLERARAAFLEMARDPRLLDLRLLGEGEGRGGGGALGGVGVGVGGDGVGGLALAGHDLPRSVPSWCGSVPSSSTILFGNVREFATGSTGNDSDEGGGGGGGGDGGELERMVADLDQVLMLKHPGVGVVVEEDVVRMRKGAEEMQGAGLELQRYAGVRVNVDTHVFAYIHTRTYEGMMMQETYYMSKRDLLHE